MSKFGPEYKTLKQFYPTLVSSLQQSPSDVVDQLIPSGVLAQEDLSFLRNLQHDNDSKARRLVDTVMIQVQSDSSVFHVFTKALRDAGSWTKTVVSTLEQMYSSVTSHLPSPSEINSLPQQSIASSSQEQSFHLTDRQTVTNHYHTQSTEQETRPTADLSIIAREMQSVKDSIKDCSETMPKDKGKMMWLAMPQPTLEELYALPLEKVWYQMGLWLGVDKSELDKINSKTSSIQRVNESGLPSKEFDGQLKAKKMLEAFFHSSLSSDEHTNGCSIQEQPAEDCYDAPTKLHHNRDPQLSTQTRERKIQENPTYKELNINGGSIREKVVSSLVRVGLIREAKKMFNSKGISFSTYLYSTDPASDPPDYVLQYADHLKRRYQHMSVIPDDWPPSNTTDQSYSELALISSKSTDQTMVSASTEKDYLHGNIDHIVAQKEKITLDEMFYPIINKSTNTSRLTILMDGAPGVGKTTIARKLCIDWANGDLLLEYQLVLYVPLREAVGDSVASLLPFAKEAVKVADYLAQASISGKNTLFIFDGFDELSSADRSRKSLFMGIIRGDILSDCSVLVASRPYASSKALSSLSRINRHVEVLGFSKSEIERFIRRNLLPQAAAALIKMLKDRLDIISMCYIPLNCKIVLFVFKQQQYKLPTTLTELYETFILHTIKRSMEKEESDLDCNVERINDLPPELFSSLNNLCKVAFDCLSKDKLYIEEKDLENLKQSLSLGLLNCLQAMNSRSLPVEHYQFLHLTIQEFLAARYLASDNFTEDRHKFLLGHIDDVRYRLTLLFLAGLKKLDFIPSNTSLLGDQMIDLIEPVAIPQDFTQKSLESHLHSSLRQNVERKDQQKLILVAHLIFESQIKHLSTPLTFCSNSLIILGHSISPFDQLVLAYFLSTLPLTHVWDVIDFSDCNLPSDSVLYTTCLLSNPNIIAIALTKHLNLTLKSIRISSLIQIINTSHTLKEVNCSIPSSISLKFKFGIPHSSHEPTIFPYYLREERTLNHDELHQICTAISASNTLTIVKISGQRSGIEISPSKYSIKNVQEMCSNSLTKLLDFVRGDSLQYIEISISDNSVSAKIPKSQAFQDCPSCQSLGSQAVDSLCRVLERNRNCTEIDLSNSSLKSEDVHSFITHLHSGANRRKLHLAGNCISESDDSIDKLLKLLEKGTELVFLGMHLEPKGTSLQVKRAKYSEEEKYNTIFCYIQFPSCFSSANILIDLSHQAVSSFLVNNQHLQQINLPEYSETMRDEQRPTCVSTSLMINAITTHHKLQLFTGLNFKVSNNILHIKCLEHICASSLKVLLDFLIIEKVEEINIENCPKAFQACAQCTTETVTVVIETLCKIIKGSKSLQSIFLRHCELNKHFIEKIITSSEESPSKLLKEIGLNEN